MSTQRDRTTLTTNEKIIVILIYNYFQKSIYYQNTNLRKEVVLATGIGERTVDHIFAKYNENKELKPPKYNRCPLKEYQAEYINAIHDLIFLANKKAIEVEIDDKSDDNYDKNLDTSESDLD
ncbi:12799_t:CDS:2 [Dentiscutata erythropus]|uniref:12799_t:CDS:1 n=1 Tax=Dentiscutata erythropus TaxID=1348616 RepID=A0A9N9BR57_9GLOM|nr:12799_t:CDS:2 [Dentiscutata erythropus]